MATEDQVLKQIFLEGIPLIDVRAEVEFAQGAFPDAVNMPILTTEERHQVGISYKEDGPETAEQLGYQLVAGDIKDARLAKWASYIKANPNTCLYCFRGGKRSQIATQWLQEHNVHVHRIPGGYKSMRQYLLRQLEDVPPLLIASGKTGVGKTILLARIECSIDLEGLAHHRGSAFGGYPDGQPSQIDFENRLAIQMLKFKHDHADCTLLLEDESRLIGKMLLPEKIQQAMREAPIVLLRDNLENRVENIYQEYIIDQWHEYQERFDQQPLLEFGNYLHTAMDAIKKRLGGLAHTKLKKTLELAITAQSKGNYELHKCWIRTLLEDYYDPMYSYQLSKKQDRIVFSGNMHEVAQWVNAYQT